MKTLKITQYLAIGFFFISSCSLSNISHRMDGHAEWKKPIPNGPLKRIVLVATNNFEGNLHPRRENILEEEEKGPFLEIGGAEILSSYIDILRKRYPGQLLLLDAGNLFSNKANDQEIQKTLEIYRHLKYDAIAFTERELLALNNFKKGHRLMQKEEIPFVNSNIIDLKTGNLLKWKNLLPYRFIQINDLRIGIIGTTVFDPSKLKNTHPLKGHYFEDPILSIIKTTKKLKRKGAELIVLSTHVKSHCMVPNSRKLKFLNNASAHQLSCPSPKDSLLTLLKRLPPHTIDIIMTSNVKTGDGFINDIPILQNPGNGVYFSRIEIMYDKKSKKIIPDRTIIHPPTKLCHQFFAQTNDCYRNKYGGGSAIDKINRRVGRMSKMIKTEEIKNLGIEKIFGSSRKIKERELISAKFLGFEIQKDPEITQLIIKDR